MTHHPEPWLIATDVDGTLFDHSLRVLPRVAEVIAAAQAQGHIVTLATGRMLRTTVPFARPINIRAPLICYQGALVASEEKLWLHQPLPLEITREAIVLAQQRGLHLNAYVDDTLYVERFTPELTVYTDLAPMAEPQAVGDLSRFLVHEPTKLVFICDETQTAELLAYAQSRWGEVAQVVQSHPQFVELTHPAASKGAALLYLAEQMGIPRERVLAAGDNHNDISMIEAAGIGVAMGNAAEAIQAYADWVAPPVGEGGLAAAIEKFVLMPTEAMR